MPSSSATRSGKDLLLTQQAAEAARSVHMPHLATQVTVRWNPRMRSTAGKAHYSTSQIELNPQLKHLPEHQREEEIRRTLLHELAHLVAHARCFPARILAHGPEWRQACADLGIPNESRCHQLPLKGRHLTRRYAYTCPHCHKVIKRVRRIKGSAACFVCCRQFAGGQFSQRFVLKESVLSDD